MNVIKTVEDEHEVFPEKQFLCRALRRGILLEVVIQSPHICVFQDDVVRWSSHEGPVVFNDIFTGFSIPLKPPEGLSFYLIILLPLGSAIGLHYISVTFVENCILEEGISDGYIVFFLPQNSLHFCLLGRPDGRSPYQPPLSR